MRIVRLINLYPPYIVGGYEMLTRDIVEELTARGHEVHVLTACGRQLAGMPRVHQAFDYSLDDKDALFRGGRKLTPAELFKHHIFDANTYRDVRRVVRQLHPDLIIADNLYMASVAPLLAVRDMPCPVLAHAADKWLIYQLRDWGPVVGPQTGLRKAVVGAVRTLVQHPLAHWVRLDGIITVSDFIRKFYVDAGFPSDRLETGYLGVDTRDMAPRSPYTLHDPVRLVFAGGLWEGKGPQVAVTALRLLGQMPGLPPVHLDIFGEGSEGFKRYLVDQIHEADVEAQVTFRGFVEVDALIKALTESDLFIFPSIWDEPFAIMPLLALGCGLPLVATRAGGTPEGFVDGETALLIEPNDPQALAGAIERLIQDEALRNRLRENGLRDVQARWSFSAYADRLEEYYQRVIERQRHHIWSEAAC